MSSEHWSPVKPGIALLATAEDPEEAAEWEAALLVAGIRCVIRDRGEEHGVEVFVPATAMKRARAVLTASYADNPDSGDFLANVGWMLFLVVGVALAIVLVIVFN